MRNATILTSLFVAALLPAAPPGQPAQAPVEPHVHCDIFGTSMITPWSADITPEGQEKARKYVLLGAPSEKSPLRKQGLRNLDFIRDVESVDGAKRLSDLGDFQAPNFVRLLTGLPAKSEVVVVYFREGKRHSRKIRVPEPELEDFQELRRVFPDTYYLAGAMLADMPREAAHFQGMDPITGVVIVGMLDESALAKAGARKGDVLLAGLPARYSAGNPVPCHFDSLSSFLQCAEGILPSGPIRLLAMRDKTSYEMDLTVPDHILADIRQRLHPSVERQMAASTTQIESFMVTPTPVKAGEPFEASVRFRAGASGQTEDHVESKLHLRILAGDKTLMSVAPVAVRSRPDALMEHVFRLKAARQSGYFVVEVTLEAPSNRLVETATLQIE